MGNEKVFVGETFTRIGTVTSSACQMVVIVLDKEVITGKTEVFFRKDISNYNVGDKFELTYYKIPGTFGIRIIRMEKIEE